ncbi:MAG TPA: acetyl ornithine aminotransferase family protein [Anaerolineaceae bacterium]|nr:acetyl ornithine aminotransferase family protein [Anaerolineaceae bacterium]
MEPLKLPGPNARRIIERDHAVISPSYPRSYPFVMDHGIGSEVWDVDGNRFLDFAAGIAVNSTGHSHPKVVQAIQEQAARFIHISSDFYHPKWVELGEYLSRIAPFNEPAISFMTNSGTESVEAAIKLARYYTGRSNIIGFLGGFHGRTLGAVSLTASKPAYHKGFYPLMNGVVHAPFPDPYHPLLRTRDNEMYGETVVRYIEEELLYKVVPPDEVAAVMVEPIQGEGGYILPDRAFFPALRNLCDKFGILLIADEVQAGIGRTGKWWSIQNFGAEPDIVCAAKGIASGMPMGAMIARKHLATWPRGAHGNTYGGNPIACAAALATLELVESEYLRNAADVGAYALDALCEIQARHACIGDVRGIGLMIGVEFVKDRRTHEYDDKLRDRIVDLAFERGLLTLGCGKSVIRISPPLCILRSQVDQGLEILEDAITAAEKGF